MSAEAFTTVLSCDMRTAPDGRGIEYAESGTRQPRWIDVPPGSAERGWADCYVYAEQAIRISATALRDQEMTGETGDHPDLRKAAADILAASADLVRILALDHACDAEVTNERWQDRVDAIQKALDQARSLAVESAGI